MENVRAHWKSLAVGLAILMVVAALGPVVFYGLPWLFNALRDANPMLALLIIPMLFVAYPIYSYAAIRRVDQRDDLKIAGRAHVRRDVP